MLLSIALVGLSVGPLAAGLWPSGVRWRSALDGLSQTLVAGLCLVYLLPHAVDEAGMPALGGAVVGLVLPLLVHRSDARSTRLTALLALLLLSLHAALDGAALVLDGHDHGPALGLAVAAHRLPVGLVVFTRAERIEAGPAGRRLGWLAIAVLALATVLGFVVGAPLSAHASPAVHGGFEALVAGTLLHVVFHDAEHNSTANRPWLAAGALVAVLIVVGLSLA